MGNRAPKTEIFVVYPGQIREQKNELVRHLEAVTATATWHDAKIEAGTRWDQVIRAQLRRANIVVVCVTADTFASGYIMNTELPAAVEREERGLTKVVPVIFERCAWKKSVLGKFQGIADDRPVLRRLRNGEEPNEVYTEIAEEIGSITERDGQRREEIRWDAIGREGNEGQEQRTRRRIRVRRRLTDLERRQRIERTYEETAKLFQENLQAVEEDPECRTRFKKEREKFCVEVYVHGEERTRGEVYIDRNEGRMPLSGDLTAAHGRRGEEVHTMLKLTKNERPGWKDVTDFTGRGYNEETGMTDEQAAEYLWEAFESDLTDEGD